MKKSKPNIRLSTLSEFRQSGLRLSIQKGLTELFCKKQTANPPAPTLIPPGKLHRPLKLSLIICTAGICSGLKSAILSGLNQDAASEDYEVLVVWNREDDPPSELIPPEVRLVKEPKAGLSHARNCGAAHACGELLLYMDDDAAAHPNLVSAMLAAAYEHPQAAIIGGQIFLQLPSPMPKIFLPGKESIWSGYTVPFRSYRPIHEQYEFPYGACFCIRAGALEALGGFPAAYGRVGEDFQGGEETALCFLAQTHGWEIGIQPSAGVDHWVDPRRFTPLHVKNTIRAGIFTSYRLCRDGYAPWDWDICYLTHRLRIAQKELARLQKRRRFLETYYKQCECEAFSDLLLTLKSST